MANSTNFLFAITTVLTLVLFYFAVKDAALDHAKTTARNVFFGMSAWLILQAALALADVYNTDTQTVPPKLALFGVLPTLFLFLGLFFTEKGRVFIDALSLQRLTFLNIVRIPVEIVLYGLFLQKTVPELMTFAGRNFDILAGLTAPMMTYFVFVKPKLSKKTLLIWNVLALGLLLNIVVNAVLSAPTPLQQFGFEQPNTAILNFPISWLPTFVVPVVLFGHLVSIRRLMTES